MSLSPSKTYEQSYNAEIFDTSFQPIAPDGRKNLQILISLDFVCPWCFIGWSRLKDALRHLDSTKIKVTTKLLPYLIDPSLPSPGINRMNYFTTAFGEEYVSDAIPRLNLFAKEFNARIGFGGLIGNTLNAHCLVSYAMRFQREIIAMEKLFEAFFAQELDISQPEVLLSIAEDIGLDTIEIRGMLLSSRHKTTVVLGKLANSIKYGPTGVPSFIMNQAFQIVGAQSATTFLSLFEVMGMYQFPEGAKQKADTSKILSFETPKPETLSCEKGNFADNQSSFQEFNKLAFGDNVDKGKVDIQPKFSSDPATDISPFTKHKQQNSKPV